MDGLKIIQEIEVTVANNPHLIIREKGQILTKLNELKEQNKKTSEEKNISKRSII